MKNKILFPLLLIFVLYLVPGPVFAAAFVPAPTLIDVVYSPKHSLPLVRGLSAPGTEVLIYINGQYSGLARVNDQGTAANNFVFYIISKLPVGQHQIIAIARDQNSALLSMPSVPLEHVVSPLPAPTLLAPDENAVIGNPRPIISGLSKSDTVVHFFIDGLVNGNTGLIKHDSGTANFAYKPFLNLSVGKHQVYAIAESSDGRKSAASEILELDIEEPMIAPTIVSVGKSGDRLITGLAANDSLIKVYVDHKLDGQFRVDNHRSGIANFAYRPNSDINKADSLIYATASDQRGKESPWSNPVYHQPHSPRIGAGVDEVVVLSNEAVFGAELEDLLLLARLFRQDQSVSVAVHQVKALEELIARKDDLGLGFAAMNDLENLWEAKRPRFDEADVPAGEGAPDAVATGSADSDIGDFLGEAESGTSQGGLINEDKEGQNNLKWNIAIFILFLLAVIAWVFWVNRELIKEQQEQEKKNQD